jgi:hypothetical protein
MKYEPQVNDYVIWRSGKGVQGWVYFKCHEYITIEKSVRPKTCENYEACSIHRNERVLVICYSDQWKELEYIKSRSSIYEEENCVEMVGEGTGRESIQV